MRRGGELMLLRTPLVRDRRGHQRREGPLQDSGDGSPLGHRARRVHLLRPGGLEGAYPSARQAQGGIVLPAEPEVRLPDGADLCHAPHGRGRRRGQGGVRRHDEDHLGGVLQARVDGDPGGGRQVPPPERLHHQHHDNDERPRAAALLLAQVLQQGPVGDQGAGGQDAGALHGGVPGHIQGRGPALRQGPLPGGQAHLREAEKTIAESPNVPCDRL